MATTEATTELEIVKNGLGTRHPRPPVAARQCPRCEERPCVPAQRLCQPCRAALQRNDRAKRRRRQLEVAARRLLALMTPDRQRRARQMTEEQQQPLSAVLMGLVAHAIQEEDP